MPGDVVKRFRKVFPSMEAPEGGLPTMPLRITGLTSDELGDLLSRYSAWREFTEDRHLEALADYVRIKGDYDIETAKMMVVSSSDTIALKKAESLSNPQVQSLWKKVLEAEIYKDLLGNRLESFSNALSMLSRELTRRGIVSY